MTSKEFGEFLLNEELLRIDADIEKVVAHCSLSPASESELRKHLPKYPAVITTKMLDDAFTYFRNTRKQLKREINDLGRKAAYSGVIPLLSTERINEERNLISEKLGAYEAALSLFNKNIASYTIHIGQLQSKRVEANKIRVHRLHTSAVDACRVRLETLESHIVSNERTLEVLTNNYILQKDAVDKLKKSICPVNDCLQCPVDMTVVTQSLEDSLIAYNDEYGELALSIKKMKKEHARCAQELEQYESDIALADKKDSLLEQAEILEKALPPEPIEPSACEKDDLTAQLAYLNEQYALAVRYEDSLQAKERKEAKEEIHKATAELAKALSPTEGVRQRLLEHQRITLQNYCNEKARVLLPKYSIVLDTKSGMGISLVTSESNVIRLESASK